MPYRLDRNRTMQLRQLLSHFPAYATTGALDVEVSGVTDDSRRVRPGAVFVAIQGQESDGSKYIPQALAAGAVAVVAEVQTAPHPAAPAWIVAPNARLTLAELSAAWQGFPGRALRVIGVTGTDGKTSTSTLIRSILAAAGQPVGLVSTVAAYIGAETLDTGFHVTTPGAPEIQHFLRQMVDAGMAYAVLEVTSHGLAQYRADGCEFDVAAVTNVTHEHMDYHKTYAAYLAAKGRLFQMLGTSWRKGGVPKIAVLNRDDQSYAALRPLAAGADQILTYSRQPGADVWPQEVHSTPQGTALEVITPAGPVSLASPLVGNFQVNNILAATTVAISQYIPLAAIQAGIAAVRTIPGRMEALDLGQPFAAYVDFAHTPNALEQCLCTVRSLATGKILVVFGCAGLRDREKRPMMGRTAARLADFTIITAEDPRTEPLDGIMAEVAAGCESAGAEEERDFIRIPDRAAAIQAAVDRAQPDDLVVITGKGHEQSMCFGTTEYPWSDHVALRQAILHRFPDLSDK
ncbi:MAG: UDP-N-acetylmuramoyl-L-alanyl-D-glutamate--2,6-diaminopimelate ligase [Chloroflexi bacterium]|nr:UDP-N-acetylmuramoyl-L-alanyl-D-glutamate--2,6-diaminopimelate ligase [Chloroflexota bacterium]